jgi:hypothetical protein
VLIRNSGHSGSCRAPASRASNCLRAAASAKVNSSSNWSTISRNALCSCRASRRAKARARSSSVESLLPGEHVAPARRRISPCSTTSPAGSSGSLARHHRAEDSPALEAGARPQRALFDHRQHAGIDQRRLAGAAVALDLQPAAVGGAAAAAQPVGVGLLLVAEAGERFEGFLAAPEEQPGILAGEGVEADEGAALDGRRRVEADGVRPDGVEQCGRQRLGRRQRLAWNRRETAAASPAWRLRAGSGRSAGARRPSSATGAGSGRPAPRRRPSAARRPARPARRTPSSRAGPPAGAPASGRRCAANRHP